ncbi:uncharacterized protein [Dysidea avara]|uniref:uncharacterized protein n=1 Tax=Dysidea avara TaxID=196820 RepID=UPI0033313484
MATDRTREKLERWRQRTGRKPMRRFSYVADYCPTDLSVKLTTLNQSGRYSAKSTDKRKPLSCINSGPNYVSESTSDDSPQKLNIKLRFDDDYLLSQSDDTSFVDDEITFKKQRSRSFIESGLMFDSTVIRYTTATPKMKSESKEIFVTPVKRSTRRKSIATPGYLEDLKSCYNSPSKIDTPGPVVVLPNKYLTNNS